MPLEIVRSDLVNMRCDAIVNTTNPRLRGVAGVDGAIHRAAGPGLDRECAALGRCKPGQAIITAGYDLPCKYIIHTVGPKWIGSTQKKEKVLASCYRESLRLAWEHKCETVAFPLIAAGTYGCPRETALEIAVREISAFLLHHDMLAYLVIYDRESFRVSKKLLDDIAEYIDENYVQTHNLGNTSTLSSRLLEEERQAREIDKAVCAASAPKAAAPKAAAPSSMLDHMVNHLDESFSQTLLRKIDEKGMTDAECYKKANIDRKLFSKIRGNVQYKPSKNTVIAFAIALELPLWETKDLLERAGFALSHSSKFDVIIEYFIRNGNYNIYEINEALFYFDQSLLGTQ